MTLTAAFLSFAKGAKSEPDHTTVSTPGVDLRGAGANSYADAQQVARELAASGFDAVKLCGGFGAIGPAKIVKAV